jgi:hypothetical protein
MWAFVDSKGGVEVPRFFRIGHCVRGCQEKVPTLVAPPMSWNPLVAIKQVGQRPVRNSCILTCPAKTQVVGWGNYAEHRMTFDEPLARLAQVSPAVRFGRGVSGHARALQRAPFPATLPVFRQSSYPQTRVGDQ